MCKIQLRVVLGDMYNPVHPYCMESFFLTLELRNMYASRSLVSSEAKIVLRECLSSFESDLAISLAGPLVSSTAHPQSPLSPKDMDLSRSSVEAFVLQ